MEKKEDRRIAMTKRLLKAALIELLKEQDIYHISIRELCERADVNRTTFYKYYGSQFDLLTDMEKDMLDFIAKAIERHEKACRVSYKPPPRSHCRHACADGSLCRSRAARSDQPGSDKISCGQLRNEAGAFHYGGRLPRV